MTSLIGCSETVDFIFSVKSPESHKKIMTIMNRVNIDTIECEIDLLGWVYEQHLKIGATVARSLILIMIKFAKIIDRAYMPILSHD
jgi:hypothetical protein